MEVLVPKNGWQLIVGDKHGGRVVVEVTSSQTWMCELAAYRRHSGWWWVAPHFGTSISGFSWWFTELSYVKERFRERHLTPTVVGSSSMPFQMAEGPMDWGVWHVQRIVQQCWRRILVVCGKHIRIFILIIGIVMAARTENMSKLALNRLPSP